MIWQVWAGSSCVSTIKVEVTSSGSLKVMIHFLWIQTYLPSQTRSDMIWRGWAAPSETRSDQIYQGWADSSCTSTSCGYNPTRLLRQDQTWSDEAEQHPLRQDQTRSAKAEQTFLKLNIHCLDVSKVMNRHCLWIQSSHFESYEQTLSVNIRHWKYLFFEDIISYLYLGLKWDIISYLISLSKKWYLYINLTLGHSVYFTPPPSLLVQIPPNLACRLYLRYLLGLGYV
jgi:hypothetical protein